MSCTNIDILNSVKSKVLTSLPVLVKHIDVAIDSYVTPMPLFRTVDEFDVSDDVKRVPYHIISSSKDLHVLSSGNCHNGQKKLTMSVLECIAHAMKVIGCQQESIIVIYAGASGMASVIAANVFKGVQFVLYDPASNTVELMPAFEDKVIYYEEPLEPDMTKRMLVFTGNAGWFNDAVATKWGQMANRREHIIFISDIRDSATEEKIVDDMLNQEKWAILTRSRVYMFKFRIPYDLNLLPKYNTEERLANSSFRVDGADDFVYLTGDLYIQLYGRQNTGELRLIGSRGLEEAYAYKKFRVKEVEDKLALFNAVYRSHVNFAFASRRAYYEPCAEYAIISRCSRAIKGRLTNEAHEALRKEIDDDIGKFIKKDRISCPLITAEKNRYIDVESAKYLLACIEKVRSEQADAGIFSDFKSRLEANHEKNHKNHNRKQHKHRHHRV